VTVLLASYINTLDALDYTSTICSTKLDGTIYSYFTRDRQRMRVFSISNTELSRFL